MKRFPNIAFSIILCIFISLVFSQSSQALPFGKNKVQTRHLEWHVFETDHFEIHYYPEEEQLAREVCFFAEEAYAHNTRLLRYKANTKTPLFLYRNQIDFQQTNILPHVIGVGTGGFTEAFKNRIALPAPSSRNSLKEVIVHEFIHALQYNILYGEGLRSFRVYKGYLIPLWVLEGIAEYAAQDWNNMADMIVRDAVLNDLVVPLQLMEGFNHLEDVYLAYKQAQLAIQYIADEYGEDKIGLLFRKFKHQISISQILRETLGVGLNKFNENYMYWMRQRYWIQSRGKKTLDQTGKALDVLPEKRLIQAGGPIWSPDGKYLAYVSNKDQFMRIYLKPRGNAKRPFALTDTRFENFIYQGRPLSWSPDGKQLAFFAQEKGRRHLYTITVKTRKVIQTPLPVDAMHSPAWSKDGEQLAFVGIRNGIGDVYLYTFKNKELINLTNDRSAESAPFWNATGQKLYYASEQLDYWQLASLDFSASPVAKKILTDDPSDHLYPVTDQNDEHLYFASDRNGIYNIYRLNLVTQALDQLTDVQTGVFQPWLSVDDSKLAFSGYEKRQWNIYTTALSASDLFKEMSVTKIPASHSNVTQQIKELGDAGIASIQSDDLEEHNQLQVVTTTAKAEAEPLIKKHYPYTFRFGPDLLFLLAGYDSSQGVIGGGYITASDYLGNHQVSLISNFVPGYQTSTQLSYKNLTYPVDMSLALLYSQNYYRIIDLETEDLLDEFNDEEIGGGILFSKPFSMFDRAEFEFSLRFLKREFDDAILNKRVSSVRLSLIHDHTVWFDYSPSNGLRTNISIVTADKILGGEENYILSQLDAQYYKSVDFINPMLVLSTRFVAAASVGPEHPVYMFGGIGLLPESATLRGFSYGTLIGSQISTLNLELRFPLARNINYSLWPLDFLMLKQVQMVLFNDIGYIGNNFGEFSFDQIKNSVGLGLRFHTFLLGKELLTIRFEMAQRTDKPSETIYTWGIGQAF